MSPSKLQALGYNKSEVIAIGRLLAQANVSIPAVPRNTIAGRRLVAHALRHNEQMRMQWEYCHAKV